MTFLIKTTVLLIFLTSSLCFAGGKVIGNGGDERALDFHESAAKALSDLDLKNTVLSKDQLDELTKILSNVKIIVSAQPVYAIRDGVEQVSIAINHQNPDTIVVYGPRWGALKDQKIKRAIALHELLSLAGIESTGNYTYSKRYLDTLGVRCAKENGLCEGIPRYSCQLIKNIKTEPLYLAHGIFGQIGGAAEVTTLESGSVKATLLMNSVSAGGLILILMQRDGKTVHTLELHGTNFPPTLSSEWRDISRRESWTVHCAQ